MAVPRNTGFGRHNFPPPQAASLFRRLIRLTEKKISPVFRSPLGIRLIPMGVHMVVVRSFSGRTVRCASCLDAVIYTSFVDFSENVCNLSSGEWNTTHILAFCFEAREALNKKRMKYMFFFLLFEPSLLLSSLL